MTFMEAMAEINDARNDGRWKRAYKQYSNGKFIIGFDKELCLYSIIENSVGGSYDVSISLDELFAEWEVEDEHY